MNTCMQTSWITEEREQTSGIIQNFENETDRHRISVFIFVEGRMNWGGLTESRE